MDLYFIFFPQLALAVKAPCDLDYLDIFPSRNSFESFLKNQHTSAIEKNANEYCNNQMLRRYLEANTKDKKKIEELNDQEVFEEAKRLRLKERGTINTFMTLPFEFEKVSNAKNKIILPGGSDSYLQSSNVEMSLSQVMEKASKTINSSPCDLKGHYYMDLKKTIADRPQSQLSDMKWLITGGAIYGCTDLVPIYKINDCRKSVEINHDRGAQRGSPPITSMPDLLDKILSSGVYDEGLKIAANKLIEFAKSPSSIRGDIFSELRNSFKASGYSDELSYRLSFDVLGMIATGGPALSDRIEKFSWEKEQWPVITALTTISSLLPMLDYYSSQKGQMYSLPPGVKGSCDTSKSYHFWLPAYFSYLEASSGKDPQVAAAASFMSSKGYHIMGNLTSRLPYRLHTNRALSPATNIVRADLSYAMAGAYFGAGGLTEKEPLNIDKNLATFVKDSAILPPLSDEEAQQQYTVLNRFGYPRFRKIFNTDSTFQERARKGFQKLPYSAEFPKNKVQSLCR